jgi:coenzyme F420 hydrogenase subunit beta
MSALPPTLQRVMSGQTCAGCGLCAGLDPAIGLARDAKGWWRPVAKGTPAPETDRLLAASCPGARLAPWDGDEPRDIHPQWGPHIRVMTANATDPEVRHTASSGGALSALAIHLLESGAVERVLHVGMDPDAPLLTHIVRSTGRADVIRAAGSRYAPAAPLADLRRELETPGRILFIGKPCDTGALRQLIAAEPALAPRFPYLLSFFCAGTPSQDGTGRIVKRLGVDPDDIARFRYRGDGWPGYATATLRNGESARMSYAESWGDVLAKEVQFRCKICADAVGGAADVAAADAWYGGESGYPAFDEADGRSLLISRTAKGDALVAAAEAAGALATAPLPIGEIIRMQPSQGRRKQLVASRLAAMALTGNPRPDMSGLKVGEAARAIGLFAGAKSCAGTIRRIVMGRR